jgi:hypothetical protein
MRVLVQNMPRLLHDIVADVICRQPDMEIVDAALLAVPPLARNEPDVAVVGTVEPENAGEPIDLLLRWPRSRVVAVSISGRHAVMYALRPHRIQLGEMSPTRLAEVIRFAFDDRAE